LTQYVIDEEFVKCLISALNCGRHAFQPGYGEAVAGQLPEVFNKAISIFEEFKLHRIQLMTH
jgi:hypothetical protein